MNKVAVVEDTGWLWPSQDGPSFTEPDLMGAIAEGHLAHKSYQTSPLTWRRVLM